MKKLFSTTILLVTYLLGSSQIPDTKEKIQSFIDSLGRSNDREVITSSIFPAAANGNNYKWRQNIYRNHKKQVLWIETILPDSISTVFFYCQDTLIFASEWTTEVNPVTNKETDLYKNIYFYNATILEDSAPERNKKSVEYYLKESKKYLDQAKLAN